MYPSQLSRIMSGDPRYLVSPELLTKIARILGTPYDWLFGNGVEMYDEKRLQKAREEEAAELEARGEAP